MTADALRDLVVALPPADTTRLNALQAAFGIKALLWPDGAAPVPVHPNADSLLKVADQPAACAFLSPYRDMQQDVLALLEAGVAVYSSGPVGLDADQLEHLQRGGTVPRLVSGGVYRSDPGHAALKAQRDQAAFGDPVFLRAFGFGGKSLQALWWRLYDLLERAIDLFDTQPRSLYLAVNRSGPAHQAVLHATFENNAQAQLTVGPSGPAHPADMLLLGSGGLLGLPLTGNQALVFGEGGQRLCPTAPPPTVEWLRQAPETASDLSHQALGRTLLLAMCQSLDEKQPRHLRI